MTLSIIGASLGRTGAASLKVALEKLGFGERRPMSEVFGSPEQIALKSKAAGGAQFAEGVEGDALGALDERVRAIIHGGHQARAFLPVKTA